MTKLAGMSSLMGLPTTANPALTLPSKLFVEATTISATTSRDTLKPLLMESTASLSPVTIIANSRWMRLTLSTLTLPSTQLLKQSLSPTKPHGDNTSHLTLDRRTDPTGSL